MEKFNFSTILPFFPGFYNTEFDGQESEYDYATTMAQEMNDKYKTDRFTSDMFALDYDEYQDALAAAYIKAFKQSAPSILEELTLNSIISPKYYNFKNDELDVTMVLSDDWEKVMREFMDTNKDWLTDRINKDWSSCSGFISFMSENFQDWYDKLFVENDERYLGTMIGYMMYFENNRIREELTMWVLEEVSAYGYTSITQGGVELETELYELTHQPGWDMTNQTEIKFD